ncbi:uncharacterized protein LOC131881238 [Tigriopus californicus]|nr:uncharacterized protein LOC131881238 [Tigriopus californicus]
MATRTRRSSLMPAPPRSSWIQPQAKALKTKVERRTQMAPEFGPSQEFDFDAPVMSPAGPMTRSRRSSIYGLRGNSTVRPSQKRSSATSSKAMDSITAAKPLDSGKSRARRSSVAPSNRSKETPAPSSSNGSSVTSSKISAPRKSPVNPVPSTCHTNARASAKSIKTAISRSPPKVDGQHVMKKSDCFLTNNSVNSDVQVVLERLTETPEIKEALDRPENVQRLGDQKSIAEHDELAVGSPMSRRKTVQIQEADFSPRVTRSIRMIKKTPFKKPKFGPASSKLSPNSRANLWPTRQKHSVFSGTPQSMNPVDMLKRNLQDKVKHQMEDTIAQLPNNTSPYLMIENETENGSPDYKFTKLNGAAPKSAKAAAKYLTATPGVRQIRPREALLQLDGNTPQTGPTMTSTSVSRLSLKRSTPLKVRPLLLFEDEDDEDTMKNSPSLNGLNQPEDISMEQVPLGSPVQSDSQMITGDLARACLIM